MNQTMWEEADKVIAYAIQRVLPDHAVERALTQMQTGTGKLLLVAIGKASWQMANAASRVLGERIHDGIVITKHGHAMGRIANFTILEAGHPKSDDQSFIATKKVLDSVSELNEEDTLLFLVSGGGSALFELPMITIEEHQNISDQLLACGASIAEINTIRKRLSHVKAGRFGALCAPARVFAIVLSDVIGDPLDIIASGPAYPDTSNYDDAIAILRKYHITISPFANDILKKPTPSALPHVKTVVTGSVSELCRAAAEKCTQLGYETMIITDSLSCEAKEAGRMLSAIARYYQPAKKSLAFVIGGETVVRLTGDGKGGRNQELALSAAEGIAGLRNTCIFSVGSDGTDGPTDAAGGYCDEVTNETLSKFKISIPQVLTNNDAYHALEACGGLIITGPTGTNVNDVAVLLIKR